MKKRFQALTLGKPRMEAASDQLEHAIEWLKTTNQDGYISERDEHGDWQPRLAVKDGTVIDAKEVFAS